MGQQHDVVYPELAVPDPPSFLDHLEAMILQATDWCPSPNHAPERAVVAKYTGTAFNGSGLFVCAHKCDIDLEQSDTICFGVIADRWGSSDKFKFVTDFELNTAFSLFRPIVRATAQRINIRCRIQYPKKRPSRPLSPATLKRLESFCICANISCLHPNDWERFYRLVRYCHARKVKLSAGKLAVELGKRKIPEKMAQMLAERYEFGRSLLHGSDDWSDTLTFH